jgi:propanol-preferring alcohol dehydrogenase
MRAYQLAEWQQAPVLRDVPVPDPGPGQVLLRVVHDLALIGFGR